MVIAIDGPAGSGKGTLARKLAAHYRMLHLDSGKLYRLFAVRAEDKKINLGKKEEIEGIFCKFDLEELDNPRLLAHSVGSLAARYSPHPGVRECITKLIRQLASDASAGIVIDGRDIGTFVLPDAQVKIFVTADVRERARRRLREMQSLGQRVAYEQVLTDLEHRDRADTERKFAPLMMAPDAHLLDTTHLDIDAAFRAAVAIIEAVRTGRKRG